MSNVGVLKTLMPQETFNHVKLNYDNAKNAKRHTINVSFNLIIEIASELKKIDNNLIKIKKPIEEYYNWINLKRPDNMNEGTIFYNHIIKMINMSRITIPQRSLWNKQLMYKLASLSKVKEKLDKLWSKNIKINLQRELEKKKINLGTSSPKKININLKEIEVIEGGYFSAIRQAINSIIKEISRIKDEIIKINSMLDQNLYFINEVLSKLYKIDEQMIDDCLTISEEHLKIMKEL